MRGISLAVAAAATLLFFPASGQAQDGRYMRLYEALWSAVNDNYYDPHFRGADWAAQRERFHSRAGEVRTDAQFVALANDLLAVIGSSHLHVSQPAQNTGGAGVGARFAEIDGEIVVTEVAHLSDARRQGLRVGDRLMSDRAEIRGELGTRALLRIRTCEGRRSTLEIRREQAFWPPEHPGFRWSRIRVGADQHIGYMRIDRFDDGAATLADRAMEELGDTSALIIDVRNNSGGNISAMRLASYFGPGAEPAIILLARPYLDALGHALTPADLASAPRVDGAYTDEAVFAAISDHGGGAAFWTDAVAQRFTGPVYVLIGPETGSAAEGFAWYMRERTNARLLGEQTAGALLSSERFDLGEGWSVTIPVHGLWGPDGVDYGDRAVPPHEEIAPARADLCAGRDPVLDAAMRHAGAG